MSETKKILIMIVGIILIVLIFIMSFYFILRGKEGLRHDFKHMKSSHLGLKRRITLYANDGSIIKIWEGRYKVDVDPSGVRFIHEGKTIEINGTFIVEEID